MALLLFLARGGHDLVRPTRIDWLLVGDSAQHLLGWYFYRADPWAWPPAAIES